MNRTYALGYDLGSSSVKCSILDCSTGAVVAQGSYPPEEMAIDAPQPGWAEQHPEQWWTNIVTLTKKLIGEHSVDAADIRCIGISYQMHGLVLVDKAQKVLRPSIIWCDSRAVGIGEAAERFLGTEYCNSHLLNSPGNFTASKYRWVIQNEPRIAAQVFKAMLPGDFIAMKMTGEITTTISGLSEGIFWDFSRNTVSAELLSAYGIDGQSLPEIRPTFSIQGKMTPAAAAELGLSEGTPVSYRAGDQPNNAFSLNVVRPGDVAATAGTSGVVYGVSDKVRFDAHSRVNPFAHVNHTPDATRLGILLCINGTGILNSWIRRTVAAGMSYPEMNAAAAAIPIGSDGITILPFGNGAERMLGNRNIGSHILGLDFNRHGKAQLLRAAQEGVAFSFRYGMDIMKAMGMDLGVIRAGNANMFLSPVFRETLAGVTGVSIELYDADGSVGAARGAAVGAGIFSSTDEAFASLRKIDTVRPLPGTADLYNRAYDHWHASLNTILQSQEK